MKIFNFLVLYSKLEHQIILLTVYTEKLAKNFKSMPLDVFD